MGAGISEQLWVFGRENSMPRALDTRRLAEEIERRPV